jgi:Orsellinic acid/F9775 biosynthesis cluster protein D
MAQPIPQTLAHLIALNVEFHVLICVQCKFAVAPSAIVRHLRDQHKTDIELRRQLEGYIQEFPFVYNHLTVVLPEENSAPQPIIPVVSGFKCQECVFASQSREMLKKHGNSVHQKRRVADEDLFHIVKLQSWFSEKKARYWVVDEARGQEQERQARRVRTRDVGEETDDVDPSHASTDDSGTDQDDVDDQIVQDIEKWKGEARERRLRALKEVPAVEMDSWLRYTKWNEVLSQSKHDLVQTFHYTRMPDPDEPELGRLLGAWSRILERCLNTLEATDHKDALKWWASPKNEAADQRPFELPQNAKSVDKYSEIFACFICYMMRTAPLDDYTDETGRWFSVISHV